MNPSMPDTTCALATLQETLLLLEKTSVFVVPYMIQVHLVLDYVRFVALVGQLQVTDFA